MPLPTFFNLPEEKREKIIQFALDEFSTNDYQSASISKIVTKAGIAKGSFYQYFVDKSDLYTFLLELGAHKKAELMAISLDRNSEVSFFDSLDQLFTTLATFEINFPELARIGYKAATGKSPIPEEMLSDAKQSTQRFFSDMLEKGISRGEVRKNVDVKAAAFLLATALSELGNFSAIDPDAVGRSTQTITDDPQFLLAYHSILSIIRDGISSR